jgi:integrase
MAHIQKRPGRGWVARFTTPDGQERSRSFGRKIDAENFLNTVEVSKLQGGFVDPRAGRVTFEDWQKQWWETTVDLRPSTRARDLSYMRTHVLPTFGKVQLAKIDHLMVRGWVANLSAAGKAPATVAKAHQVLSKALRGAVDAGLLAINPAEKVTLPRVEREEVRFLEPVEIQRLADLIDERYRAFILVGAYGGLRFGELAGLRRGRVDLLKGTVTVAEIVVEVKGHHVWGPPKTRAGRRTVPLPRFVVDELTWHLQGVDDPEALVFPSPAGSGPLRASLFRRRIWHPAVSKAGLDGLTPHGLRHTAVALWIAAGASPKEVAVRAGHTSVVTVLDRYGHLLPSSDDKVTDALDAIARTASETGQTGRVLKLRRDGDGTVGKSSAGRRTRKGA